jgi:hypothetical protein
MMCRPGVFVDDVKMVRKVECGILFGIWLALGGVDPDMVVDEDFRFIV